MQTKRWSIQAVSYGSLKEDGVWVKTGHGRVRLRRARSAGKTKHRHKFVRTADDRFQQLPGYDFSPRYLMVDDTEGGQLRLHYLDEGPRQGSTILLLHGEPSWSYLYRKMVPILADAGHRVIAPDLIGFGRSDKPTLRTDYTYQRHVDWIRSAHSAATAARYHAGLPGLGRFDWPSHTRRKSRMVCQSRCGQYNAADRRS